jgi:hypothetical protein
VHVHVHVHVRETMFVVVRARDHGDETKGTPLLLAGSLAVSARKMEQRRNRMAGDLISTVGTGEASRCCMRILLESKPCCVLPLLQSNPCWPCELWHRGDRVMRAGQRLVADVCIKSIPHKWQSAFTIDL